MNQNNILSLKNISILIVSYLLSFGLSYAFYPVSQDTALVSPNAIVQEDRETMGFKQFADKPKTEVCPTNGALYSKEEKDLWESKRPILAMIENDIHARPQSGLGSADIVYEALAEGGITRFMGVFYCEAQSLTEVKVAPVRSARIYFVNLAAEYNTPVYMHVGGGNCSRDEASGQCTSNKKVWALEELQKLGWRKPGGNDFDTIGDIGVPVMKRDFNRLGPDVTLATEHTYVGYLSFAWKEAQKRGFTSTMSDGKTTWVSGFTPWKFDSELAKGSPASKISYGFWDGTPDFDVVWNYDQSSKKYLRNMGGKEHQDLETKQQIAVTNVIIQFTKSEGPLDEHKHMFFDVVSSGTGYYFTNGVAQEIKWKKSKQTSRTIFTDLSGKELNLTPGQFWISILPTGNKVVYN